MKDEKLLNPVMDSIKITTILKIGAMEIYELADGTGEVHVLCEPFITEDYRVEIYHHGKFTDDDLVMLKETYTKNRIVKVTGDFRFIADGVMLILNNPTVIELEPPVAMALKKYFSKVKIWLDDVRPMSATFDEHVKTAPEAIELIQSGCVRSISLDHDLGDEMNGTGHDVAIAIAEGAKNGTIQRLNVCIHSAPPVIREKMTAAITNAKKYWASEVEV